MYKVGDVVEMTAEAAATGMLDFEKGKAYEVIGVSDTGHTLRITDESGRADWYYCTHFKLKADNLPSFAVGDAIICIETEDEDLLTHCLTNGKEYIVKGVWGLDNCNVVVVGDGGEEVGVFGFRFKRKEGTKAGKKECLFKEGQVVWDIVRGRGVIGRVDTEATRSIGAMPVIVVFDSGEQRDYTYEGVSSFPVAPVFMGKRTLFFSEPKIEAATEPVFEPVLKKGDWVVLSDNTAQAIVKVVNETDTELFYEGDGVGTFVYKSAVDVYRLGEKINFK